MKIPTERCVLAILSVASISVSGVSEFYLQREGLPAFMRVCEFFFSICHDAALSYRATAMIQNHGGDMMLPIAIFSPILFVLYSFIPEDILKEDREALLKTIATLVSILSLLLIGLEIISYGQEPNTNAHTVSGLDFRDVIAFSVIPITTVLFFYLQAWRKSEKNSLDSR